MDASQSTAGQVVLAHLHEQVRTLQAIEPQVHDDKPGSVHKMRVATRRLRSALATFRPLLDRSVTDPIRDELRWLATVLGAARDAEVMHARLTSATGADNGLDRMLPTFRSRLDVDLLSRYRQSHNEILRVLSGDRYRRLCDALDALVADPPFTERAKGSAGKELCSRVAKEWRLLRNLVDIASNTHSTHVRQDALHEVRKAAKRTRYAAESLVPTFGRKAARFASAIEVLQEVLGDYQDSVVTREELREMASRATAAGEQLFHYGRLYGLEEARAQRALEGYDAAWKRSSAKRLRNWMR